MIKVSESLQGAIENFLEVTPEVLAHMENGENPHAVTKEQIGLGELKNEKQATAAEFKEHKENCENPHGVTKEQIGLGKLKNEEQATAYDLAMHKVAKSNPHAVTKEQVGLSLVKNAEQATAEQYAAHIGGEADMHSAEHILYSQSQSVKEKLDEIEGNMGVSNHSELSGRDDEGAHPISAIEGLGEQIEEFENRANRGNIYIVGNCTDTPYGMYKNFTFTGDEKFIKDGHFTMPEGAAALIEITVIVVCKEGRQASYMKYFKQSGKVMRHTSGLLCELTPYISNQYFAYELPENDEVAPPANDLRIENDGDKIIISASGDNMDIYNLVWKATIELKNYVEVGA